MGFFKRMFGRGEKPQPKQEAKKPQGQISAEDRARFTDGGVQKLPEQHIPTQEIVRENRETGAESEPEETDQFSKYVGEQAQERRAEFQEDLESRVSDLIFNIQQETGVTVTPNDILDPNLFDKLGYKTATGDYRYTKKPLASNMRAIEAQYLGIQRDTNPENQKVA